MEIKPEGLDRPGEQAEQRLDPFDRRVAMTMAPYSPFRNGARGATPPTSRSTFFHAPRIKFKLSKNKTSQGQSNPARIA